MSTYSAENIQTLLWHEAIRKRPGMYIGAFDSKAFLNLIKNIISDIGLNTKLKEIQITLKKGLVGSFIIEHENLKINNHFTSLFRRSNYFYPHALPSLNALSNHFEFQFFNNANTLLQRQLFKRGISEDVIEEKVEYEGNKIVFHFQLDNAIWGDNFDWNLDFLLHGIQAYAYLHKNVKFEIQYSVGGEPCKSIFRYKNGLNDRLKIEQLKGLGSTFFDAYFDKKLDDFKLEAAFAFRGYSVDETFLKSYCNDEYTSEGGTHVDALLKGLTYGVMKYFQKHNLTEAYKISEKGIREGLVAILNIRLSAPIYSGCVRNKLANPEIIEPIAEYVSDILFRKMESEEKFAGKLIRKFEI